MTSASPIRLALIDDHALVRDGLRALLSVMPQIEIVGEAEDGASALKLMRDQLCPDLILMDIGLKDTNGLELTRQLCQQYPGIRILILSMYNNDEYVRTSIRAGACGYVLKDASAREIVAAIEAVAAGGSFYSTEIARKLAERSAQSDPLTPRETDILHSLAKGLDNKTIARDLNISVRTVETHRLSIRRKLKLESTSALIKYALDHFKT
ncbi:two component transcriptional regulator, LuxR family [Azomonas agilis]|uniref:Two component transcriptional regulator, LuxR family n=1 Tax=Azomonas agilis TaxID=116849 RepID=A0A562I2F7_9GAMM|nr:response regulator transcription factor [Azomonas agilis]TWH64878.1 two component transcriptional regulator, LuxR family [Azomonas agilis]